MFYLERNVPSILRKCYPQAPERADTWLASEIERAAADPGAAQVFGSVFYLPPPPTLTALVRRFGGPTLICNGALDPLNDARARGELLASLCPTAQLRLLSAGHCPHDESPAEFGNALRCFLQDIDGAAAAAAAKAAAVAV
jgi:pimeloyl-ACP methyl ester carboxylesterase